MTIEVPETANGLECGTCHSNPGRDWSLVTVMRTIFPDGVSSALAGNDNLCSNCHSGRIGKADIDRSIAANQLRFQNVHYLPAAATRQGIAAKVGYEYEGKSYAGPLGDKKPQCSAMDTAMGGDFTAWTPALMKAAHTTTSSCTRTPAPGRTTSTTPPSCSSTASRPRAARWRP